MPWGEVWDPDDYVARRHPEVKVVESAKMPPGVLGCVDHERRIIWLAQGLGEPRRRCTYAYEIAQLEQGPSPDDPYMTMARERVAADWAARQLISTGELRQAFAMCHTIPQAAAWLDVDTDTLRARLRGLLDDEQDQVMSAIHHLHRDAA